MFKFSKRTGWELGVNALTARLDALRKQGVLIYDLTESNPTRCEFTYPKERLLPALANPRNLLYAPHPKGMREAREAVCAYYRRKGVPVDPGQVFLTSGTSEGYSFLFRLLMDPRDAALFPVPSYPLFQFLVDLNDIRMVPYPLRYREGWSIDIPALKRAAGTRSRAIVLVNPNNPTGSFVSPEELKAINAFAAKRGIALISDEVFEDYTFEKKRGLSLVNNADSLTFVLGGLSKTMAMPQMKLSWIIVSGPSDLVAQAGERLEVITDTYLSVNTPVQNAAPVWLEAAEDIQKQVLDRVRENRAYILEQYGKATQAQYLKAAGGWYAVLKVPSKRSEEEWVAEFLEKDHVWVHPGYFFDFEEEGYLVISLLPPKTVFEEGLDRVMQRLAG